MPCGYILYLIYALLGNNTVKTMLGWQGEGGPLFFSLFGMHLEILDLIFSGLLFLSQANITTISLL